MRGVVIAVMLVAVGLTGCFGDGDDAPGLNAGAEGDMPMLPEGLAMDGAEVVSYNETSVVWHWTGAAGPGAWNPASGPTGQAERTTFDVPRNQAFAVKGTLAWQGVENSTLGIRILDGDGMTLCRHAPEALGSQQASCTALHTFMEGQKLATIAVEPYVAERDIPFVVQLRLTVGPPVGSPGAEDVAATSQERGSPHVVIGFADSGINPYHEAFRDDSAEASTHPSVYLDGYPADARALNLTLDAPTYADALAADAEVWAAVETEQLYWVPGTRIVGAIMPDPTLLDEFPATYCRPVLDCLGHGTMVAGRAVAPGHGLCSDCKVVMAQGLDESYRLLGGSSWVDVVSVSFINTPGLPAADADALASKKPIIAAAGNGIAGQAGVVGHPGWVFPKQGTPNVINVGGHDNGRVTLWPDSFPQVAADACGVWVADHWGVKGGREKVGTGTSGAAPYAAGAVAALVVEAKRILGDVNRTSSGTLVEGPDGRVAEGPLADGRLSLMELKEILFSTADPRPKEHAHDGFACDGVRPATTGLVQALPVEWQTIPEDVPAYYFIGYGAVNEDTLEHAKAVLSGEEPMPERPVEDAFFALDQEVRKALVEMDP